MFTSRQTLIRFAAAVVIAACGGERQARDPNTPSGYKIPRYVSISSGKVNGRAGPSEEHPVLWTYKAPGLPVQIVAETEDWRRICDPEGGLSWVKRGFLNGPRYVMRLKDEPLAVHKRADASSGAAAYLSKKGVASLDKCEKGWCLVRIGKTKGWVTETEVWGTASGPQCRGASGMTRPPVR
jgi:SH3-like domain-containing protein